MDRELLDFLGGSRRVRLDELSAEMRIISAYELIGARSEAAGIHDDSGLALAACVLSRAVFRDSRRLYDSGEEALKAMTAERITALMEVYSDLAESDDPSFSSSPERIEALKKVLDTPMASACAGVSSRISAFCRRRRGR